VKCEMINGRSLGNSKPLIVYSHLLIILFVSLLASPLLARRYNPFVWTTYKNFSHIYSITLSMDEVYLGTNSGLLRFNRILKKWDAPLTKSNGFPGERAEIVAIDKVFSKLWIVTDYAIAIYIPQISLWENSIQRSNIPSLTITSIGFTQERIFLEGSGGIYSSRRGSFSWKKWNGAIPQDIDWSGERNRLSIQDYPFLTPYYVTDEYFNRYEYTAIAVDNKDMWLGTDGSGVFHTDIYTWNGKHYTTGLANNRVDAIFYDEEGFWLGGRDGLGKGITHINFEMGEGKHFFSEDIHRINSDKVYAITGDDKKIWIGTKEGLLCYKKEENIWKNYTLFDGLPSNTVTTLIIKKDTLFIGTENGMAFFSPTLQEINNIGVFNNTSINGFALYNDNLLIATEKGVFVRKNKEFETISDPDGDFSFGVTTIFVGKDALWFGTKRSGIDVYYPDSSKWEEYLYPTTISGEWIFSISGDEDYIWIGTNNGATRYNKKMKMWKTFNETDGLADNRVRTIYVEKDYVWFGTENGLTRFKYRDPSVPP